MSRPLPLTRLAIAFFSLVTGRQLTTAAEPPVQAAQEITGKVLTLAAIEKDPLASQELPAGQVPNRGDFQTWMEGEPNLDTDYALIALSHTRPKAK